MDVRCEKCKTEYEFEDDKVTEAGITVKCTSCGHVFKVKKKAVAVTLPAAPEELRAPAAREWRVRQANGNIFSFKELTTLQKWIVERKVARDDEISLTGDQWKRLGNIAELASFFQVVEAADRGAPQPYVPGSTNPGFVSPYYGQPGYPPQPGFPPQPQQPGFVPQPQPYPYPQQPQPQPMPMPMPAAVAPVAVAPAPPPPAPVPPAAPPMTAVAPGAPAPRRAPVDDELGDLEDDLRALRGGGNGKWIALALLLLAVGGVGGWYVLDRASFERTFGLRKPELSELARAQLARAEESSRLDTIAGYEKAVGDARKAIELAGTIPFPDAHAAVALAHVGWFDLLGGDAEAALADAKALQDPPPAAAVVPAVAPPGKPGALPRKPDAAAVARVREEAEAGKAAAAKAQAEVDAQRRKLEEGADRARADARLKLDEAFKAARKALELDPDGTAASAAMAAYYRASGDAKQMEAALSRLKDRPGAERRADVLLTRGLAIAGDPVAADQATRLLSDALEVEPRLAAARHALARLQLREKAPDKARTQAEKILTESPDHAGAKRILAALAPPPPPPAPPPVPEPVAEVKAEEPKPKVEEEPSGAGSFERALEKANSLRESDRPDKAMDWFEKAGELDPGSVEPLVGKGLCQVDMRNYDSAIRNFNEALKRNPRFGAAWIGLGEAQRFRGDKQAAVDAYTKYLEVNPAGSEASVARAQIAKLQAQ